MRRLPAADCTSIKPSWTDFARFVETVVRSRSWQNDGLSRTRRLCSSMQGFVVKMPGHIENLVFPDPRSMSGRRSSGNGVHRGRENTVEQRGTRCNACCPFSIRAIRVPLVTPIQRLVRRERRGIRRARKGRRLPQISQIYTKWRKKLQASGSRLQAHWLIGSLAHWLMGSWAHGLMGSWAHWLIGSTAQHSLRALRVPLLTPPLKPL